MTRLIAARLYDLVEIIVIVATILVLVIVTRIALDDGQQSDREGTP